MPPKNSSDGLKKLAPGKWLARITARDPKTGKKTLDTDRVIHADTKLEALAERKRIYDDLVGCGDEWTVSEALDAWMPTLRGGTLHARKTHEKRIREAFGSLKLSRVPSADVQRWLAKLPGEDVTANLHRATLKALYKHALHVGRLKGANPIDRTVPRHTPKTSAELLAELEQPQKPKAMLGDVAARFFAALEQLHPVFVPVAKMQLLLGCRWSEVTTLRWSDIDWDTGVVTILRGQSRKAELGPTKGKRKRLGALGPEGIAFLRGHRAAMERLGWPGWETWMFAKAPMGKPRKHDLWGYETSRRYVHDALRAAEVDLDAVTHAFRHTHVTLARSLSSDAALRASVGHEDERQTETYTDDSHRRAVAQSFGPRIEERLAGGVFGGAPVIRISKSFKKTR